MHFRLIDWFIDRHQQHVCLGLFYAKRLGNCIHCMFILIFCIVCFLFLFFAYGYMISDIPIRMEENIWIPKYGGVFIYSIYSFTLY